MYNVHVHCLHAGAQWQLVTDRIGVLLCLYTSTCIYRCVLCSCMHAHGLMHVQCTCTLFTCRCSMDVSQLVTDKIGVLLCLYTSTCIYRCVLCSCMHTHGLRHVQCTCTLFTCRCSMDVLQLVTDRIGVLLSLYTSTCIYRCVLCRCMHTHGLMHVQCTCTLFTCRCSMDVSQLVTDRIGVLLCLYRCVLCSCMHTHDSTFVLQVLESSNIGNITF